MPKVGFLGIGKIGTAMAANLLQRGDAVVCWNRTVDKARALESLGATTAATPLEAVVGAERVHLVLFDDASVDEVIEVIRPGLAKGVTIIDHTTTSPLLTKARAERLAKAGIAFLHAPVVMNPMMCRRGEGMMLVSGPTEVFEAVRPALELMANPVVFRGARLEDAATLKLVGNSLLFAISAGVADALALARHAGVEMCDAMSVLNSLDIARVVQFRGDKMVSADFSTSFDLQTVRKDLGLMLGMAARDHLIVLPSLAGPMDEAIAAGYGRSDLAAITAAKKPKT